MRLGVPVPFAGLDVAASVRIAAEAERLGYAEAWSSETDGADGLTPLAALAQLTSRLRLGSALLPAYTRPPALLAMSAASLQSLSGGRFVLGLGSSSRAIVEGWMGGRYADPVSRVRDTVEAVRAVLSGERVDEAWPTVRVNGFRLSSGFADVPIMLGGLGPRMCRLAGETADGLLLMLATPAAVPSLLADAHAGAADAGRQPGEFEVVCRVPVALGSGGRELRTALRRYIVSYGVVPAYNRLLCRQGFTAEADAMSRAWRAGRRAEAAAAVTDRLLDALVITGSADDCAERVAAYREAGVTSLMLSPVSDATDPGSRERAITTTLTALAGTA